MNIVNTGQLPVLPYNKREIFRYCGVKEADTQLTELLEDCLKETEGKIQNRICFCEFSVTKCEDYVDLGFCKTDSKLLTEYLSDCKKIVLFAATVGMEMERLIKKYSRISPARAVIFEAIGSERIESLCDAFEHQLRIEGKTIKPRVSCGYGDIPLLMQRDIFAALDCAKKIGVALNESLLMSPSKSVTAIVGVKDEH